MSSLFLYHQFWVDIFWSRFLVLIEGKLSMWQYFLSLLLWNIFTLKIISVIFKYFELYRNESCLKMTHYILKKGVIKSFRLFIWNTTFWDWAPKFIYCLGIAWIIFSISNLTINIWKQKVRINKNDVLINLCFKFGKTINTEFFKTFICKKIKK